MQFKCRLKFLASDIFRPSRIQKTKVLMWSVYRSATLDSLNLHLLWLWHHWLCAIHLELILLTYPSRLTVFRNRDVYSQWSVVWHSRNDLRISLARVLHLSFVPYRFAVLRRLFSRFVQFWLHKHSHARCHVKQATITTMIVTIRLRFCRVLIPFCSPSFLHVCVYPPVG